MINICLDKRAVKKRYKTLQDKYTASEEALDHAIYSWANANEKKVSKEGIDIDSAELEDYLDRYFKIKSDNTFTDKKSYERALKIFNSITKTEWNSKEKATIRYNKYVEVFGEENTVMYKTSKGTTIVRLAEPMQSPKLEMQSIKEKAIANGTFMKAPNGNPTNLTERQWLQVRTKAFKNWFGDWEIFNKINPYNTNIKLGNPEADLSSVDADGFGTIIPVYKNESYIGEIAINNTYKHGDFVINGNYVSMSEVGDSVELEEEHRGKGYGKAMYFEFAKQIANKGKILRSATDSSRTPASTRVWESLVRDGYAKRINNRYEIINSSLSEASKVVDENGEPLVVYHSTTKEFNTFDLSKSKRGEAIWFKPWKDSSRFGTKLISIITRSKDMPVFLNIKNPSIIDKKHGAKSGDIYTKNGINKHLTSNNDGAIGYSNILVNKEDLNISNIRNKDGVEIVVFNPNQIKSATNNTGEFSRSNDDINLYEDDFFNDDTHPSQFPQVDSSLKKGKTYSIDKLEELFNAYNTDKEQRQLSEKIFKVAKRLGFKVSFLEELGFGKGGLQDGDVIKIARITTLERNKEKLPDVILHEVIHGVSSYVIDAYKNGELKDQNLIEAAQILSDAYNTLKNDESLVGEYGIKNEKEMLAEMANPKFREKLKAINIWTRIKEAIKKIFSINSSNLTADKALSTALDKMLDNYDVNLFEDYSRTKDYNTEDFNFYEQKDIKKSGKGKAPSRNSKLFVDTTPKLKGKMSFAFGNQRANGVTATTTLEAIKRGERTATTRYTSHGHIDYWKQAKVGDVIEFSDQNGEKVLVRVTKELHQLPKSTTAEEWSSKEGWDTSRFEQSVRPKIERGEAYQMEFEYIDQSKQARALADILNSEESEKSAEEELDEILGAEEEDVVEKAVEKLNNVRKEFESKIKFDSKTHTYIVYDSAEDKKSDTGGHRAISVTQYLYGKKDIGAWGVPSSALGNTNDAIIRDFFHNSLKKSYPNLNSTQLRNFVEDLEQLRDYLKSVHGENCRIITEEFPIAGRYTVMVKGKPEVRYLAGTMDMIVIDENGKYWGYDMKAKRSGVKSKDRENYGNQLGLYGSIFSPYGIDFEGTRLIHSSVWYEAPDASDYRVDDKGQLYDGEKKIQSVKGYQAPRLVLTDEGEVGSNTIIPVKLDETNKKMTIEMESLSSEDKDLAEEEFGSEVTTQSSSITYGKGKESAKSGLYNPILSASERKFLADQVMQQLSFIVTHLQTAPEANNYYFPDGRFAGIDFTSMSREDICNVRKGVGVAELLNIVKERIIEEALVNAADENIERKLWIAYKYFNDLKNEGYSKLITLEGVPVVNMAKDEKVIEDTGDEGIVDDNDTGSLEEKEREYYQLGQRQISAKSSLSKEIRRMFERLKVLDKNGNTVKDSFGFGLDTFVDANIAVNNIFNWCQDCTTIEEMEEILVEKAESNPYLNTILEKIQDEPIRSLFFRNFRKDSTIYSIVRSEVDSDGNIVYSVHTINTKGATETIMKNLSVAFQTGGMQHLIITRDDVEGKGRVNTKSVEAILAEKEAIAKRIHDAFASKKRLARVLEKESANIASLLNKLGVQVMAKTVLATINGDTKVSNMSAAKSLQLLNKAGYIAQTLLDHKDARDYNPMLKEQKEGNTYNTYKDMVSILEKNIEDSIEASTYENGKMYYSFVTPSYMGKLVTNLKNAIGDEKKFKAFLKENYSDYRWFYDRSAPEGQKWNNTWLQQLAENPKMRQMLEHKVQLSFGKTPYNELSELGYTMSLMQEYFYDKGGKWAWYRLPILANKPSSEFVRFVRYSGKNYKRDIKKGLKKVFNQEILRIQTVLERAVLSADSGINKIGSYDIDLKTLEKYLGRKKSKALASRIRNKEITKDDLVDIMKAMSTKNKHSGAEFRFLEMLNNEFSKKSDKTSKKPDLGQMIVDKINDKAVDENKLDELLIGTNSARNEDGAIDEYMKSIVEREFEQWESIGLFESDVVEKKDKKGNVTSRTEKYKYLHQLGDNLDEIKGKLTEYIWNDMFATINIIQLTVTDLAYYKNMEDFQKRYAQVHSPALRLNTTAEYNGVRVSDGKARTIYIKDYEVKSEIIPCVREIFDRKIASITSPSEKKQMMKMRDLILSSFERVNVTDAQGYSSPTSYRKKMIMAGSWDETMEKAYQRIAKGEYNVNDLGVVWQPLKPFVYSQIRKTTGVSKMSEIKVPVQNKNSEYMLLLADALMRGAGRQSTLGAIFDFMEESHLERDEKGNPIKGTYRQDGIDTVQFESAVKSGLMGVIDINDMSYKKIKDTLESAVYYSSDKQASTDNDMDRYNDQFVHTIPFEDYGIQQEVPAHLVDHMQAMGSQVRILSISDISEGARFQVHNQKGTWDREHLIERYQELHAQNIIESFEELARDLNLKDKKGKPITNRKLRNKALSEIMIDAIKKDQRYGADLMRACSLDKNGEFIVPPNDPIQSQRIQQLINSIIKSRINKQKVQGGPVVQASVFGMSDDLHIVFNDKNGKPLIPRSRKNNESNEEYQKYLQDFYEEVSKNQGSLAYMEVYMPIPSEELEKALTKEDGSIMDIDEAVSKGIIPEEMLKAIGYRIPTEDKYSMIPMKIKGFLPKAAGEALMMPREITLLTGSDFDIDKIYVMLKEFTHKKVDIKRFTKAVLSSYAKKKTKAEVRRDTDAITTWIKELDSKGKISTKFAGKHMPVLQRQIEAIWEQRSKDYQYFMEKNVGNLGRENTSTRNNEIFDIQWAVLTNEDTMSKMFNPGSFDVQKKSARIIKALKAGVDKSYKELAAMSLEELDTLSASTTGNIIFSTTQVAFHKQNMTAGKLIGIFANNNTSHAFLSMQHIHLNLSPEEAFTIDGHTVSESENNELDRQKAFDGSLISKNIAGFLAASVDAVKDPVLNFMNLNTFTAGPAMVLARLGFDSDSIGLLLTQPIIEKVAREYFRQNNDGYVSVEDIIKQELDNTFTNWERMEQNVSAIDFTKEALANSISEGIVDNEDQAMVLLLFKRLAGIAKNVNTLTFLTKFNSVSNAVGPTIADTLVMRERFNKFLQLMESDKKPFSDNAVHVIDNSPILSAFYETTVGDRGASRLIFEPYFPQYSPKFTELLSLMRETTKAQLDAKTINKLVNDFTLYKLTIGENPIINSNPEQRNRFINNFVKEFKKRAEGIVDNELINIISAEPSSKRCPVPVLNARTGGFNADMQERIKAAWSTLMENPETFDLGRDLFIYNLYRNGFTFSPKTFLHLASVDTKLAMGEYIDAVADPRFNDDSVSLAEFLLMFRRNHAGESKIVPTLKLNKSKGGTRISATTNGRGKIELTISYDKRKVGLEGIIANKKPTSTVFAPVIEYNGKLYYTEKYEISGSTGSVTYVETSPLGNTNNFLEYNANESAVDMTSVLGKKTKKAKESADSEGDSRSDDSVNHDDDQGELTEEEMKYLFDEGPLSRYAKEVIGIAKTEGDEAATTRTVELMEKFVAETNKKKAKEKVEEILKRFCK